MHINIARFILSICDRTELRDHAFGDVEITWSKSGREIATGYFGSSFAEVILNSKIKFEGKEAHLLRNCGVPRGIERNDETGPDDFVLGRTMPGLTKDSVLREITTPPKEI